MGFPRCFEDICDRYFEAEPVSAAWVAYLGPQPHKRDIEEAANLFGSPLDRPRRVIKDFWVYYGQSEPLATLPASRWETHFQHVEALHAILGEVADVQPSDSDAWDTVSRIESRLKGFFLDVPVYGTLSRRMIRQVAAESKSIRDRCNAVVREIERFEVSDRRIVPPADQECFRESRDRLRQIRRRFDSDLEGLRQYDQLAGDVRRWGDHLLTIYPLLAVQSRYRPALQHLNRLRLHDQQDGLVARDYEGAYRVQGASGSGKTIVLVHRAIRLALEHPEQIVRVFTVNRSLADLLRPTVADMDGNVILDVIADVVLHRRISVDVPANLREYLVPGAAHLLIQVSLPRALLDSRVRRLRHHVGGHHAWERRKCGILGWHQELFGRLDCR